MKKLLSILLIVINIPSCFIAHATYIIGCNVAKTEIVTGIFKVIDGKPKLIFEYKQATNSVTDFTAYITSLFADIQKTHNIQIKQACFAAPGNTNAQKNYICAPHLPFVVDGTAIATATALQQVLVVNDFECIGFGIEATDQKDMTLLHQGKPRDRGTKTIVGAGNGLGTGLMLWDHASAHYMPSPLSYSFVDFCPESEFELNLSRYLQETSGSHSWGKVLGASGGIMRIYDYLDMHRSYKTPAKKYDNYTDIFVHRLDDERCADAVTLYMKLYARLVRNVAYAQLPYNGLYITNTVAELYPDLFTDPSFLQEYFNTGNEYLHNYLLEIPLYVATHPNLQLYGAALYALVYASSSSSMG